MRRNNNLAALAAAISVSSLLPLQVVAESIKLEEGSKNMRPHASPGPLLQRREDLLNSIFLRYPSGDKNKRLVDLFNQLDERVRSGAPESEVKTEMYKVIAATMNPERPKNSSSKEQLAAIDFGQYIVDLDRKINIAWSLPARALPPVKELGQIKAAFQIHNDGSMSNLKLVQSSRCAVSDQSVLKAIQNAAPFERLPDAAQGSVTFEFTFNQERKKGRAELRAY